MSSPRIRRPATAIVSRAHTIYNHVPYAEKQRPRTSLPLRRVMTARLPNIKEDLPLPAIRPNAGVRFTLCNETRSSTSSDFGEESIFCDDDIDNSSDSSETSEEYVDQLNSVDSTVTSSNMIESEDEEPLYDYYHPCEFDLRSEAGCYNFEADGCHFGRIPTRFITKRLCSNEVNSMCNCFTKCSSHDFGRWATSCMQKKYLKPKTDKQRKITTFAQVPSLYQRLYGQTGKDCSYKFHHYDDLSMYMKQYRENHVVILRQPAPRKPEVDEQHSETPPQIPFPDPYLSKIKQQAYRNRENKTRYDISIAENCDFFAIFALDKETDACLSKSTESDEDARTLSVKERGKNINLAPVREATVAKIQNDGRTASRGIIPVYFDSKISQTNKPKLPQKPPVSFNQYLNLVIPKTTLHRTNLHLNLDTPREACGSKFDSKRNPKIQRQKRVSSADSSKRVKFESPRRAASLGSNPTKDIRLSRANTSVHATDTRITTPPQPKYPSSNVNRYKANSQKFKCANRIRAMTNDSNSSKNTQMWDRLYEEKVLPSPVKPFKIEGRPYQKDDQLNVVCRLQKEKERTERSMRVVVK